MSFFVIKSYVLFCINTHIEGVLKIPCYTHKLCIIIKPNYTRLVCRIFAALVVKNSIISQYYEALKCIMTQSSDGIG